ncbi:DUF6150 family protein [Brumimicrobium mesophilum]|uniref:DUF6150 family protein n=1 Tax=Brumimicrobium mesophilum TaxID=392717 RepID=UPI000D13F9BD|nr:DUF6150 family protein [Brumimicrobium mesophilum]
MSSKYFISFFILLFSFASNAQKIHKSDFKSAADLTAMVVDSKSAADLLVYAVDFESELGENDGKWFFVNFKSQSDKSIFFVDLESKADIKIYFVDFESEAGWITSTKKQFLE